MRKRRKITTMDTQERYFQNSLGHPSLPTALFFLADPRALIGSISGGTLVKALLVQPSIDTMKVSSQSPPLSVAEDEGLAPEMFVHIRLAYKNCGPTGHHHRL